MDFGKVTVRDQSYQAFPHISIASDKHRGRRPGNEATSDVIIVGRYDTLVVYDGNIQGCKSLKTYLLLKTWAFLYPH